jgi:PAP2 superfamily
MCDCHVPPTPQYAVPPIIQYSPPAAWDPKFDPDNPDVGGPKLAWVPDAFKHRTDLVPPPSRVPPPGEFDLLFRYQASERTRHCQDICRQNSASMFADLFVPVLGSVGKPGTNILLANVETDTLQMVLFQKKLPNFNRARSYQIYPSLDPAFTPGHASYPSGHSTQSHSIAGVIELILQRPDNKYASVISACLALSDNISVNRERAGVHFPSDTEAGKTLAHRYIAEAQQFGPFKDSLTQARTEW